MANLYFLSTKQLQLIKITISKIQSNHTIFFNFIRPDLYYLSEIPQLLKARKQFVNLFLDSSRLHYTTNPLQITQRRHIGINHSKLFTKNRFIRMRYFPSNLQQQLCVVYFHFSNHHQFNLRPDLSGPRNKNPKNFYGTRTPYAKSNTIKSAYRVE